MDKMEPSPKDSKHANNLTTRGNAMLKTFLPDSLKSKAKLPITTKCKAGEVSFACYILVLS